MENLTEQSEFSANELVAALVNDLNDDTLKAMSELDIKFGYNTELCSMFTDAEAFSSAFVNFIEQGDRVEEFNNLLARIDSMANDEVIHQLTGVDWTLYDWSFTYSEVFLRACFPLTVQKWEDFGNEHCHEMASSKTVYLSGRTEDTRTIYTRYPGEKDSFGWLIGVESLVMYAQDHRFNFSYSIIACWG